MTFSCIPCNKNYKTYQSIWNHNKKFHSDQIIHITEKVRNFSCNKCNKTFTRNDSLKLHINNTCKKKNELDKVEKMQLEILELKKELNEVKSHHKIAETNNTVNGTLNNGTINNIIYINKPGTENLLELNKDEIKEIFNKDITSLVSYIEKVNFNDRLKSNHSFCTTNLGGAYLSVFDTDKSKIKQNRKKYFFEEIISITVSKMEELYKLYKSHFKPEKQKNIEETLKTLNELKSMDMNKKIYKEMLKQLNILSYNDRDVVEDTWNNKNIKGKVPRTFEEDLEMSTTEELYDNESDDSDSEERPQLIGTKPKNTEIIL